MKRILNSFSRKLLIVNRIEFIILLVLVILLLGGSLYAIMRPVGSAPVISLGGGGSGGSPGSNAANRPSTGTDSSDYSDSEYSVFTGIGRLRIPITGSNTEPAATMILSIAFPYPHNDRPFTEELASKITDFKIITTEYFSSLSAASISNLNEDAAKAELLRRYNALLRLGKIEALYFSDLIIIEAESSL